MQRFNFLPFYQTDFDGIAEIYGLQASWTPVRLGVHLGGYIGSPSKFNYWWTLSGGADFQSVGNPGRTGLAANTSYGWLSAEIGGHLEYNFGQGLPIIFADASYSFGYHVINSITGNMGKGSLGIYLNEDKNASVMLTYENGIDRQTLTKTDKIGARLGFRF